MRNTITIPMADWQKRHRIGKWIPVDPDQRGYASEFECSGCKAVTSLPFYIVQCDYEYCPHCGAKMNG